MEAKRITDDLSVASQLSAEDVPLAAADGFKSILCNRPDGEAWGQPDFASIKEAAKEAGLKVLYQPVNTATMNDDDIEAFEQAVNDLPKPVLAYCRTGTRGTVLWSLSQSGKRPAAEIIGMAADAGYDMRGLAGRLE